MRVWIEIILVFGLTHLKSVSPSYEGVDWNLYVISFIATKTTFHPLMRVWIEMKQWNEPYTISAVSPSYEGVDWNYKC